MSPTLDHRRTSRPRVLLPPSRLDLRRARSYHADRGLFSPRPQHFNLIHLVFSPPPSPGLPSPAPPLRTTSRRFIGSIRPIRVIRYTIRISSIFVVFYISLVVLTWLFGEPVPPPQSQGSAAAAVPARAAPKAPTPPTLPARGEAVNDEVEMVSQKDVPDFPTPIAITDHRGRAKWTVSIPPGTGFPLSTSQYADMCVRCRQVAARARELRSQSFRLRSFLSRLWPDSADPNFIDVQEAQRAGYLPRGSISTATGGKQVCKKSLTFVLESDDAGLGKTLLMLWIAYGLARKEDRAFFIDDTRWAYGNYTDIFLPPPLPDCAAPPAHEILPCPRQARHLVVSAETADEFFRGILKNNSQPWSDSRNHQSRKEQFDLARQGYEALFRLNSADSEYVASRLHELTSAKKLVSTIAVGIHVRRGDRHPLEFEYRRSYIPLYAYADAAGEIIMQRNRGTTPATGFLILSSDDPAVYASEELRGAIPAQDRIRLGLRETLHTADVVQRDKSVIYKFVDQDDISNDDALSPFAASRIWHGGFFSDTFWNLGLPANAHAHVHAHSYGHSHSHGYAQIPVTANGQAPAKRLPVDATRSSKDVDTIITDSTPRALHLRSIVGRAYVMDLAVLAGASDDIVCAVSAVGCRLLAIMMGWKRAIVEERWVNIDGGAYGWLGLENWGNSDKLMTP